MNRALRQPLALLGLVAVDLVSKLLAYAWLPLNQPVSEHASLQLVLRVNTVALGSAAQSLLSHNRAGEKLPFLGAVFSLTLAVLFLLVARISRLTALKIFMVVLVALAFSGMAQRWIDFGVVARAIAPVGALRLSEAFLWIVIWWLVSSPWWRRGALLFAAAATGNAFSLLYPPHGIVDFLWSVPLNRMLSFGVFNLADVMWLIGFPVFLIALFRSLIPFRRSALKPAIG